MPDSDTTKIIVGVTLATKDAPSEIEAAINTAERISGDVELMYRCSDITEVGFQLSGALGAVVDGETENITECLLNAVYALNNLAELLRSEE